MLLPQIVMFDIRCYRCGRLVEKGDVVYTGEDEHVFVWLCGECYTA